MLRANRREKKRLRICTRQEKSTHAPALESQIGSEKKRKDTRAPAAATDRPPGRKEKGWPNNEPAEKREVRRDAVYEPKPRATKEEKEKPRD